MPVVKGARCKKDVTNAETSTTGGTFSQKLIIVPLFGPAEEGDGGEGTSSDPARTVTCSCRYPASVSFGDLKSGRTFGTVCKKQPCFPRCKTIPEAYAASDRVRFRDE